MRKVTLDQNVNTHNGVDYETSIQEVTIVDDDIENYWLVISHDNNFLSLSYANYEKLIKLVEKAKNKIKKL